MSNKIKMFSKQRKIQKEDQIKKEFEELEIDPVDSLYGAFFELFDALSNRA